MINRVKFDACTCISFRGVKIDTQTGRIALNILDARICPKTVEWHMFKVIFCSGVAFQFQVSILQIVRKYVLIKKREIRCRLLNGKFGIILIWKIMLDGTGLICQSTLISNKFWCPYTFVFHKRNNTKHRKTFIENSALKKKLGTNKCCLLIASSIESTWLQKNFFLI